VKRSGARLSLNAVIQSDHCTTLTLFLEHRLDHQIAPPDTP
jgi:hypothetical protein